MRSPWWTFGLWAIVPVTLVAALAWRARSAAIVEAQTAEAARWEKASSLAEKELEILLRLAEVRLSKLPEDSEPLLTAPSRSLIPFALDELGRVAGSLLPSSGDPPSPPCVQARVDLLGATRPVARALILDQCPRLRSQTGRFLWPLLALEDEESALRVPRWLEENGSLLSERERETLRARWSTVDPHPPSRGIELLSNHSNDAVVLRMLLEEGRAEETTQGNVRIRRGAYVALMRTFADRRTGGLLMHARSVLASPPALPDDLMLVSGAAKAGTVTVAPQLVFHLAAKDPHAAAARMARAGNIVLALAGLSLVAALGLGGALYSRFLRARKLAELRTDFVAAVSHELRTPAATVLMLSELLEQRAVAEDERREVEESLAQEARRMSETLSRMLRFGALSRGKLATTLAPAKLRVIADEAAARFRRTHPDRSVEVSIEREGECLLDAGLLGLALDNLLVNAAKYAPTGGPYRVGMVLRDDKLVISVRDRGPGLDKDALARIFLPFERADDRLSKATEGTGIGLALVRGIAEAHGGVARAESTPNQGATFIIEVPWKPC